MRYRVCNLNPDGTVTTATAIPDDLPTSTLLAEVHGGEVLSLALYNSLRRGGDTPADGGVPVQVFKRRLAKLYFALGFQDDTTQRRWDRVLSLLDSYTTIYPAQEPVASLIAAAVSEGLLTQQQADALSEPA